MERGISHEPEPAPVEYRVVRVFPLSLAPPSDVFKDGGQVSLQDMWFTRSLWLMKGPQAVNPHQLMLPGGNIAHGETMQAAARRELSEETNISLIKLGGEIGQRKYEFNHPQGRRHVTETVFRTQTTPFAAPKTLDPADKASGIASLNPGELQALLEHDVLEVEGTHFGLIENLRDSLPSGVAADLEVSADFKEQLREEAMIFEMRARGKIYERLLERSAISQGRTYAQFVEEESQQSFATINQLVTKMREIDSFVTELFEHNYGNMYHESLERELRLAQEEVFFKESLDLIEGSGPQKDILMGQFLMQLSTITTYEIGLIRRESPTLFKFLEIVHKTFSDADTRFTHPQWHSRVLDNLAAYKALKYSNTRSDQGRAAQWERELWSNLEEITGISEEVFCHYADRANKQFAYFQQPYAQLMGEGARSNLYLDTMHVGTGRLDELVSVMFGVSQYKGAEVSDIVRGQAFGKIIMTILLAQFVPKLEGFSKESTLKIRSGLMDLVGGTLSQSTLLDESRGLLYARGEVERGGRSMPILMSIRKKSDESAFRQLLERYTFDNYQAHDDFGVELIIDAEGDERENLRDLTSRLLGALKSQPRREQITIKNVRDELGIFNDLIRGGELGAGHFSFTHEVGGSAASSSDWKWLKFVATVDGKDCEFQIFPTVSDRNKKKEDDPRFALHRQIRPHREGRVSILELFNRLIDEETYEEIKKKTL